MQHDPNNLFLRLSKWATGQGENFLTEAFAITLQSLLRWAPESAVHVVSALTDGFLVLNAEQTQTLIVETQTTLSCGRPDLELRLPDCCLIYIEVKDFAGLGHRQAERYLEALQHSMMPRVRLILLSRHVVEHALAADDVVLRRWFHIAECIEQQLVAITHPEARFVTEQFFGFLQAKGLVMTKVEKIDDASMRSLRSLCLMIEEAASSLKIQQRHTADWTWICLYLDRGKFAVGVEFESPEVVRFLTAQFAVSKEAAEQVRDGRLIDSEWPKWTLGSYRWCDTLDLSADNGAFYSLSKGEQLTRIEFFIRRSVEIARSLGIVPKAESLKAPDNSP